jgi:hypothetical protein
VEVDYNQEQADGPGGSLTLTRTWSATDSCGLTSSHQQVITVVDTQAPVLVGVQADATAQCNAVPVLCVVTGEDNCGGSFEAVFEAVFEESRTDGHCANSFIIDRTWTATDDAGLSTSATQRVTVQDTIAPTLIGVPKDAKAECDEVPGAPSVHAIADCDGEVSVTYDQVRVDGDCPNEYTLYRTWAAFDGCDNEVSETQVIVVSDTKRPVIFGATDDVTVEAGYVPELCQMEATDNCDTATTFTPTQERLDGDCTNSYTLVNTYTATAACGNTASVVVSTFVEDTTPPVFEQLPPSEMSAPCAEVPEYEVYANDRGGDYVRVTNKEVRVDGDCENNYDLYWTWWAIDACGNMDTHTTHVNVYDDEAPTLTGVPDDDNASCEDTCDPADVEAGDNCDADLKVHHRQEKVDGPDCDHEYFIVHTWTVEDSCGLTDTATQTISVYDNTAPTLTHTPEHDTVCIGNVPKPAPVMGEDNCDKVKVEMDEQIADGPCLGAKIITRTWTATDQCGNPSDPHVQVITVEDCEAPEMKCTVKDLDAPCDDIPEGNADQLEAWDDSEAAVTVEYSESRRDERRNRDLTNF